MEVYETRWDFIGPLVESLHVLDIGPAELVGTVNRHKFDRWIHRRMTKIAASVTGLDENEEQVRALVELGFDIRLGNAEVFDLNRRFDVVVAGELIEHLSNPGSFLDCARAHLSEGGKLLITTPNRYSILSFYDVLSSGVVPAYSKPLAKHVGYQDSDSLASLLRRHGFGDIQIGFCKWVGAPKRSRRVRILVEFAVRSRPVALPVLVAVAHPSK